MTNHPLIDQLKTEAAHLPEDRIEQLVAVLIGCIETHEAEMARNRAEETCRILRKAVIAECVKAQTPLSEALGIAEAKCIETGLQAVRDDYQSELIDAHTLFHRMAKEAGLELIGGLPSLDLLPQIFAATGASSRFDWRVTIDADGVIQVNKRENMVGQGSIAINAENIQAIGAAFQINPSLLSSAAWLGNLEQAMDREIFASGTLQLNLKRNSYEAGVLRAEDLDQFFEHSARPVPYLDLYSGATAYHHTPIEVGRGTEQRNVFRQIGFKSSGMHPDGADAAQIRGGTVYLNRQGKIICIDYD